MRRPATTTPPSRRIQGRRDPDSTRRSLLEAAIAEFSEKGLAGARVDEIAARAGVNKQLVYHHFGTKEDLYAAALEEVYAAIRTQEQALRLSQLPPLEAMERLVGFSFDYLAKHPEFVAILNDENQHGARHVRESPRLMAMHSPLVDLLGETLARGAAEGLFRNDLDPVDVYISIAGITYFYFSNNHTLSAIFGARLGSKAAVARRRRHTIDFVLSALRPQSSPPKGSLSTS
ncbi:TetR/AcrR family transcriptional regulator [Roseomonas xinghualingensis]|uniref:TetR/AcrR family transcriptional regulator n=1 Tax=Roseomonas xinghualingensis TaxID=2986475 RepID=UPI0021F0B43E|nr:TetR/AcrR family transcriptional regulator [Roseomonas sp. SXEYE001]MCV4208537.1 TetR family transcriptional regulator [Roseomonas sp. SXEYE001]